MIYKIQTDSPKENTVIEFKQLKDHVGFSIYNYEDPGSQAIVISQDQLYDMIGSLITIQQKIQKGGRNGRG